MGKLEDIDVRIFCAAAMDFYRTQVKQVVAARWVSYKPYFPFGLYGVFQNFVTFFFEQRKKMHFILNCSVVEALQVNNPCLQFFHIHGQFHKPESSPLLFMTFFRGRGKEGSWFGVVGRRGGKRLLSMPGVAPFSVLPLFLDRKTVRNLVKIAPEIFFRIKILRISRPFVFILWNWVSSLAQYLGSQGCGARLRTATFETSCSSEQELIKMIHEWRNRQCVQRSKSHFPFTTHFKIDARGPQPFPHVHMLPWFNSILWSLRFAEVITPFSLVRTNSMLEVLMSLQMFSGQHVNFSSYRTSMQIIRRLWYPHLEGPLKRVHLTENLLSAVSQTVSTLDK